MGGPINFGFHGHGNKQTITRNTKTMLQLVNLEKTTFTQTLFFDVEIGEI